MSVLNKLLPKEVFGFFEELSNIPRTSGNEKQVSDYLVDFAKKRELEVFQDEALNVIIKKGGTKGYEKSLPESKRTVPVVRKKVGNRTTSA